MLNTWLFDGYGKEDGELMVHEWIIMLNKWVFDG